MRVISEIDGITRIMISLDEIGHSFEISCNAWPIGHALSSCFVIIDLCPSTTGPNCIYIYIRYVYRTLASDPDEQ